MRLTDATVVIRPRSAWESLDLGLLLARRHVGLLMGSWALLSLPVFGLLTLLLWQHPTAAILLFWWLKPTFERLPLHILAQALFARPPSLKQSLRALPGLLRPQLLASLTWRRLSLTRSVDLPVLQLEHLSGQARAQRVALLGQNDNAGTWLTLVGSSLEWSLCLGLFSLLYLLLPHTLVESLDWQKLILPDAEQALWLDHLGNLLYVLVLIVWEPMYVACGFTLYLNRRTALEAWDIELVLRRLRQRLTGSAYALLLGLALLVALPGQPLWAAAAEVAPASPPSDPQAPTAPRLLLQPLNSASARQQINDILHAAPFKHSQTVTRWRFASAAEPSKSPDAAVDPQTQLARLLEPMLQVIKVTLWGLLLSLLVLLIWRYRQWLQTFAARLGRPQTRALTAPSQLFGMELAPHSLPDDVASTAERLWLEDPRAALGLLYRALLSRLLHEHQLPLKQSHTEGEVLRLVQHLRPELSAFSHQLTGYWQALAYGHQPLQAELGLVLCTAWRQQFEREHSA